MLQEGSNVASAWLGCKAWCDSAAWVEVADPDSQGANRAGLPRDFRGGLAAVQLGCHTRTLSMMSPTPADPYRVDPPTRRRSPPG